LSSDNKVFYHVIAVSYDAFRNEYFDRNVTSFMNNLRFNGTRSNYMRNVFPTKTFPNHHTIATGVFPDVHGVLANSLYDSVIKKKLDYSFELYHFKSEITPIWILNEMNGGRSGCMMWPGSDFDYNNFNCSFLHPFKIAKKKSEYFDRVDEMFKWIRNSTSPPNLIMFYIEEPDTHAHAYGPNSQTISDFVATLNNVTEYIYNKIHDFNLQDKINVIHLSDHGMDELELRNVIDLTKIIDDKKVKFYGTTPVLQIVPNNDSETDNLYQKLFAEANKSKNFSVYLNKNLPERWKFANNDRTGPITVVANLGFGFQDMFQSADWYEKTYNITKTPTTRYGVHG
jgi:ectonucleotide pyrophosphatase/phosphodiesterase family member 5